MTTYYNDSYFDYDYDDFYPVASPLSERAVATVQRRMAIILMMVILVVGLFIGNLLPFNLTRSGSESGQAGAVSEPLAATGSTAVQAIGLAAGPVDGGQISPVFTAEVRHWEPEIIRWADAHGLDPNLVAIIMQIESCGDPLALSGAGAQGLFQVMPFHFAAGEDALDPDTNAHRGLSYYVERLNQTNGDVGRAFAGYNGGHRAAASEWDSWPHETQRYYRWSTGIYRDIQSGLGQSPTIQAWLQAGGASLCRQAAGRIGLTQ